MNPYEVLGLDPGGTYRRETIELAHKIARKKYHPDREGGSEELMSAANTARDILLNPERKRRFDEFGSTGIGGPTIEEQAIQVLGQLFQGAMEKAPADMPVGLILNLITQELVKGQEKAREAASLLPKTAKRLKNLTKKFEGNEIITKMLEIQQLQCSRGIQQVNQQIVVGEKMLAAMQSIRFK